jgi:hypothetical protein
VTRVGWPLLTVETEANGASLSTNEGGLSLVGSLDSSCQYNGFLSCLVSPVQNIIILTAHFFTLFVLIIQQPRQAGVLGRLSLEKTKPAITWKIELKWIPGCRLSNRHVSSSPCKRGHFVIKARKKRSEDKTIS